MAAPMRKARSDFPSPAFHQGHHTASGMGRQQSAKKAELSNDILDAVESGDQDQVRAQLMMVSQDLADSVLSPNLMTEHGLRTPLMAAAASGDFALFGTVMHAVDRYIERMVDSPSRAGVRRLQLETKDEFGMTVTMLAARSGNVGILGAVLEKIQRSRDFYRLVDKDYGGTTVLMHSAQAGSSAVFSSLFLALQHNYSKEVVEEQLLAKSGDDRTILMHAARCGDQMGVLAVVNACKRAINPSKVRDLLKESDGDDLTFLMHAAAGSRKCFSNKAPAAYRQQHNYQQPAAPRTRSETPMQRGGLQGIPEELGKKDRVGGSSASVAGEKDSVGQLAAVSEDLLGDDSSRSETETLRRDVVAALMRVPDDQAEGDDYHHRSGVLFAPGERRGRGKLDPALVVFKTAWRMVKGVLWKEEVRDQLRARDSWGRTILTHAVLSGRLEVFDAVLSAVREELLDYEINALMGIDKEDDKETIMEVALEGASKEMADLVARRDQQLKKNMRLREKASTIEAKIQAFIPGKLIVIFQLLLPEVDGNSSTNALILLLVISGLAPLIAWASDLILKEESMIRSGTEPRRSKMSLLLSAPAMFFWGIGTSDVGTNSLHWDASSSAAALAVATIVIPALDGFFGNTTMERCYDKWSCQHWRFSRKMERLWLRAREKSEASNTSHLSKNMAMNMGHPTDTSMMHFEMPPSSQQEGKVQLPEKPGATV